MDVESMKPAPTMELIEAGRVDGIQWAVCRAPVYGAANGYAKLPEGHPWIGLDYDEIEVEVNGGLTYASGGWIGFDTLHGGDLWAGSGMPHYCDKTDSPCTCTRWTDDLVAVETRYLARQVARAMK